MKLIPNHPFSQLSRVADFDEWFRNPFAGFPSGLGRLFEWDKLFPGTGPAALSVDIHEDQDHYYARFEIPGVKKEDIKIELDNHVLTVSAEKKEKRGATESSCSLTRSISVPEGVQGNGISAKLEDGMLTVTLPKAEERKPKTIPIS